MSIDKHKWSDSNVIGVELCGGQIEIECESWTEYPPIRLETSFNKNDAIAIAKHFNEDRESLVEGIKELISSCEDVIKSERDFGGNAIEYQFFKSALQKLITKNEVDKIK